MEQHEQGPSWKLTPEQADELPPALTQEEMHRAAGRAEPKVAWKWLSFQGQQWRKWSTLTRQRTIWKPMPITLGVGIPGILLSVIGTWFVGWLSHLLPWIGILGAVLIIVGLIMFFAACPRVVPEDWTPAKQQEIDETREYFKNKRGF